jgi:hypothetical protein
MTAEILSSQYSAGALLAVVLLSVIFGILLPRWTVNQIIRAKNEELKAKNQQLEAKEKELNLYREAVENYRQANLKLFEASDKQLVVNEVTTKALHALTTSAHRGEPDEVAHTQAPS